MRAECSPEEFSEEGAGASNRPQSRVYKILTQTRYTTVTKTNQVIDCDRFENTRKSHKDGHVGTTRAGIVLRARRRSRSRRKWITTKTARGQRGFVVKRFFKFNTQNLQVVVAQQISSCHNTKPINATREVYFVFIMKQMNWPQL